MLLRWIQVIISRLSNQRYSRRCVSGVRMAECVVCVVTAQDGVVPNQSSGEVESLSRCGRCEAPRAPGRGDSAPHRRLSASHLPPEERLLQKAHLPARLDIGVLAIACRNVNAICSFVAQFFLMFRTSKQRPDSSPESPTQIGVGFGESAARSRHRLAIHREGGAVDRQTGIAKRRRFGARSYAVF